MLLLSPDKTKPERDNDWIAIDYSLIYKALNMIDTDDADITIKILINDYMQKIRSEFKMDINDELKQQAIEIYKNNREIFEFIYNNKPNWREETAKIIRKLIEKKGATLISKRANTNILFTTTELTAFNEYRFQLNVNDMSLYLCDIKDHIKCSQWLFGNNKDSVAEAKRFEEEYVFELDKLNEECSQLINRMFEPDGIIAKCLITIKKP